MRRFVLGLFAAIGIVVSLVALGVGSVAWYAFESRPTLPDSIVLTADLNRGLAAGSSPDALSEIVFGDKPTLRDFLDALERAGDDQRVKALHVQLGAGLVIDRIGTHLGPPLLPPYVAPPYVALGQVILNGSRTRQRGARVRNAS